MPLIPAMRAHIYKTGIRNLPGSHDSNLVSDQGTPIEEYSIVFRDLFCTAAADLADNFHIPLEEIGILYDDIVETGKTLNVKCKGDLKIQDVEREALMQEGSGSGQLMFLTRQVDTKEAQNLQAAGFRFAQPEKIIELLAKNLQLSQKILLEKLDRIRDYVSTNHTLDPGVHLACFTIRASLQLDCGGFEILARRDATNLLPTMRLPFDRIELWQSSYLDSFDSMTIVAVMRILRKATLQSNPKGDERIFSKQLLTRLEALKDQINDSFFNDATLSSKPIEVPCRGQDEDSLPGTASLIVLTIVVPIQSRVHGKKLVFVPINFFQMQQLVYRNSPDHAAFAQRTLLEFAPVLGIEDESLKTPRSRSDEGSSVANVGNATIERRTFVDELLAICIATRA